MGGALKGLCILGRQFWQRYMKCCPLCGSAVGVKVTFQQDFEHLSFMLALGAAALVADWVCGVVLFSRF